MCTLFKIGARTFNALQLSRLLLILIQLIQVLFVDYYLYCISGYKLVTITFPFIIVPLIGCDAITNDGACFKYFTSFGINWRDARVECLLRGYDLASLTSSQENDLLFDLWIDSNCWIGLNDIGSIHTFTWIDGSDSTIRIFYAHTRANGVENCIDFWGAWSYSLCTDTRSCYYCRANSKYIVYIMCGLEVECF